MFRKNVHQNLKNSTGFYEFGGRDDHCLKVKKWFLIFKIGTSIEKDFRFFFVKKTRL